LVTSRFTIILLTVLAVAIATSTQAEIVSDMRTADKVDARLAQTTTLQADCARLADFVSSLAQSTGIGMAVGWDKDDWQSYDRKITAQVKDVKLCVLMHEIAAMMGFTWSRSTTDGQYVYVLFQSEAQRSTERARAATREDEERNRLAQKRTALLKDMANLGAMAPEDAAALKSSDPWRYVLATESLGRQMAAFFRDCPEAGQTFLDGVEAVIPVASLASGPREMLRSIVSSYGELTKSIGGDSSYPELLEQFDKLQLTVNSRSLTGVDIVSRSILGRLTIARGSRQLDIPLFDPSTPLARTLGAAIIKLKGGESVKQIAAEVEAGTKAAIRDMNAADDEEVDITSNPALQQSFTVIDKDRSVPFMDVVTAISSKTGLNVLADCYGLVNGPVTGGNRTLGAHLLDIRRVFGKDWQFADGFLVLRDRTWFVKRAWEVPQVWMDYWIDRGEKSGELTLDDLTKIAQLRDEQLENTIAKDAKLVSLGAGDAVRNKEILRFYGSLTKDQQATLESGKLGASGLTDEQWGYLGKALIAKGAAYAGVEKKSQYVTLDQSGTEIVQHVFRVHPEDGSQALEFKVVTGFTTGATYREKPSSVDN